MVHTQTLISIVFFWVVVHCITRVVSDDDDVNIIRQSFQSELANKLNMLVRHSGWQLMESVKIIVSKNNHRECANPISVILEAKSSGRNPIDEFNVIERFNDLWTVLSCKYAEVVLKCKILIKHFIRVCQNEKIIKTSDDSFQRYHICFKSLLSKLHSLSSRFKCMADALDFMYLLGSQAGLKQGVMVATQKLTEFTSTVGPRTSSKLSEHGINEMTVDIEIKIINDFILGVYNSHIYRFVSNQCILPSQEQWTIHRVHLDFQYKKSNQQIPEETTMVQFVKDEMDSYVSDILDSCFFNLGFAYDLTGNVTIRNN